ncbi:transglycosylase SLT domain-containing protein [Butyrivibrio sp.]|uniref:transglycosylase SLT domain-containing protein n=1 Tax=Butyrivibrio sp. TaxID=28121 RepID=UPI0025BAEA25|nr:transglycosylase SLT domain-containing protein [Butyrivibrio sp.]MBQ7431322.1 transglycosylase SLT domain-containing protein [Butyrivibrio sp.]MBQ9302738.1 transglycosylase SLT domain-containing protein [Butyrivibrio sp.]
MKNAMKITLKVLMSVFCGFFLPATLCPLYVYAKTDTDVPVKVAQSSEYYGGMYGIDPNLIRAICFVESSYIPTMDNGQCKGIMEVNTDVHQDVMEMKNITDIYDIDQNINCGAWVLYQYLEEDEDINVVLMRYNGDYTGLKNYYKTGAVSEYVNKVLDLQSRLKTDMKTY